MSSVVLIQFVLSLVAAFLGAAVGWWLRGQTKAKVPGRSSTQGKQTAGHVLQSLQAAADTVRSCIEQHTECIRTIQSELNDASSTEPAIITKAAESIINSNCLAQHQIDHIQTTIDAKRQEIRDCLASTQGLLFTFASLDRQKHVYRQVLSSLETLAAELASDIKGHGRRLKKISNGLAEEDNPTADGVVSAVTQILDATSEVQRQVAVAEQRIAVQAASVNMQAILSHTDLLTSLPNRRALEAELQRVAAQSGARSPFCTLVLVDLDGIAQVNKDYSHQGGDLVLRQTASMMKKLVRGRDMVARFGGDTFAILLSQTTLHDALPIAERVRKLIEEREFSHGRNPLRVTASVGVAQLTPDEIRGAVMLRAEQALQAANDAGGNICYRHDGQQSYPVSSAFQIKQQSTSEETLSLAALWRDSSADPTVESGPAKQEDPFASPRDPSLSGRTLFATNLNRRLAEWKRGGPSVSVALMRLDQMPELLERFGDQAQIFLRQVVGRLLEASTRDMDERCEFEDGIFAMLLPGIDEPNAMAVAERLLAQVRQCKVRLGNDLWDLTVSIGVAHCTVASRVMDIILSAEAAMNAAAKLGGDAVCVGEPMHETPVASSI